MPFDRSSTPERERAQSAPAKPVQINLEKVGRYKPVQAKDPGSAQGPAKSVEANHNQAVVREKVKPSAPERVNPDVAPLSKSDPKREINPLDGGKAKIDPDLQVLEPKKRESVADLREVAARPQVKELRGSGLNAVHPRQQDGSVRANLAKELGMAPTIKGISLSPGRALGSLLRLPGRALKSVGQAIQGKNQRFSTSENKARYAIGGAFKILGNAWGGAAGFVGGAVVFIEHKISDYGGLALRGTGALILAAPSLVAYGIGKLAGNTSLGEAGLKMARDLVPNSPLFTRRTDLAVTPEVAKEFSGDLEAAMGGNNTSKGHHLKEEHLPQGLTDRFKFADRDEGFGFTIPVIDTGGWTKVTVIPTWGTPVTEKNKGEPRILYLNYQGSNLTRNGFSPESGMQGLANIRTDIAQGVGIPDGAFREGRNIAKMFVDHYKGTNVTVCLVGHSMGGALAQYAGISASTPDNPVRVTCFNSAGLHPHLLEQLGGEKINISNVTHFTSTGDPLQFADGKYNPLVPSMKVGVMYGVPIEKFDHGMKPIDSHFKKALAPKVK